MKKLQYLDEDHTAFYRYFCYFVAISLIVIFIYNPNIFLKMSIKDIIVNVLTGIIVIGLLGTVPTLFHCLITRKYTRKYKEIKQRGTKTTGKIIGWDSRAGGGNSGHTHYVYVSYTDLARKPKSVQNTCFKFSS